MLCTTARRIRKVGIHSYRQTDRHSMDGWMHVWMDGCLLPRVSRACIFVLNTGMYGVPSSSSRSSSSSSSSSSRSMDLLPSLVLCDASHRLNTQCMHFEFASCFDLRFLSPVLASTRQVNAQFFDSTPPFCECHANATSFPNLCLCTFFLQ